MLRRALDASLAGLLIAIAVAVAVLFVVSKDAHDMRARSSPSPSSSQAGSTPTLAELARGSSRVDHPPRSPWPSAADYATIVSVRKVIDQALRERDWRRKSYGALLGMYALTSIHPIARGRCAWLVNRTYDELQDFHAAYQGENWAPMVTVVHHDPPVTVCRAPRRARPTIELTS